MPASFCCKPAASRDRASIYDWWLLYTPLHPAFTAPFPLSLATCFSHAFHSLFKHVQVRMAYLSNERLVWLQQQSQSSLPSDLLLQGALLRLSMQDQPSEMASALMQPRSSYCSNLQYGLPGGQEHIDLPVHHVWDLLAPNISVKVSGQLAGIVPSNPSA